MYSSTLELNASLALLIFQFVNNLFLSMRPQYFDSVCVVHDSHSSTFTCIRYIHIYVFSTRERKNEKEKEKKREKKNKFLSSFSFSKLTTLFFFRFELFFSSKFVLPFSETYIFASLYVLL